MHSVALLLLQNQPDPEMVKKIVTAVFAIIPFLIAIGIAIVMVPCWFILKKAGFSPWLSLLCIIPSIGTLVLLYIVAFSNWPALPVPGSMWQNQPPYPPPPPYPPQA
jgi:hypothetical protein